MSLRNFLFISILVIHFSARAETLKSLAQKSTLLLSAADDSALQKRCSLSLEKISQLSQKLKAQVDQKIAHLTENDYAILNQRAELCQSDCSCNIYSLAYEARNKKNEILSEKASKETASDRKNCVSKIKNICSILRKI